MIKLKAVRNFTLVFATLLLLNHVLTPDLSKDEKGTWCAAYDAGIPREELVERYADARYNGDINVARLSNNIAIATRCPEHKDKLYGFDEIRDFIYSWEK